MNSNTMIKMLSKIFIYTLVKCFFLLSNKITHEKIIVNYLFFLS